MTNAEYWEERMENAQKLANKNIDIKLKKLYKALFNRLDNELTKLWLEMTNLGEISTSALLKADRYRKIREIIQEELMLLTKKQDLYLQESLIDSFINGWMDQLEFIGIKSEFTITNKEFAKEVVLQNYKGANFSERIWHNMDALRTKLDDAIMLSATSGTDVRKVAKKIQDVLNVGFNDAKRITITETSRVYNEACRHSAIESGYYKTYTLLMEKDACKDCKKLKGKHIPLEKSVLPVHPYCKCTMLIDID